MNSSTSGVSVGFGGFPIVALLIFATGVALMVFMVVRAFRASRRRKAAIAAVVTANGFAYLAEDPSLVSAFEGDPFGQGSARRARDVVAGTHNGGTFTTFAYSYETTSTDADGTRHTTVHPFQVTWIPLPAPFPHVRITPDSAWLRMWGALAGHDVGTESAAFNARWRVRANDERTAHAILTGPMIERLMLDDVRDRALIFQGARLMSCAPKASDLSELSSVVGALQSVAALVPPFLINDLRERQ